MYKSDASLKTDGIYFLSRPDNQVFDLDTYLKVRKREGRLYPDSIVKVLPSIECKHPLKKEWAVREKSFNELLRYFSKKKNQIILEVGCGNGWLGNGIASNSGNFVIGVDLNIIELKQAVRVFGNNEKLDFAYGNIFEDIFPFETFDLIIFPSSIQYFENVSELINRALYFIKPGSEIHIIDSYFYDDEEAVKAAERTKVYFEGMGYPQMIKNYHHHRWSELNDFDYEILNTRKLNYLKNIKFIKRFGNAVFPWIVIKKWSSKK